MIKSRVMKTVQLLVLSFLLTVVDGVAESTYISVSVGPKTVKEQIKLGDDLNAKNEFGDTPLMVAAFWNEIEVTWLLIEAGADVNFQNENGNTALSDAAAYVRLEIVNQLVNPTKAVYLS